MKLPVILPVVDDMRDDTHTSGHQPAAYIASPPRASMDTEPLSSESYTISLAFENNPVNLPIERAQADVGSTPEKSADSTPSNVPLGSASVVDDNPVSGYIIKRDPFSTVHSEANALLDSLVSPREALGKPEWKRRLDRAQSVEKYTIARPSFTKRSSPSEKTSETFVNTDINETDIIKSKTDVKRVTIVSTAKAGVKGTCHPIPTVSYHIPLLPVLVTDSKALTESKRDETKPLTADTSEICVQNHSPKRVRDMFPNWGQVIENNHAEHMNVKFTSVEEAKQRSDMVDRMFKEFCVQKTARRKQFDREKAVVIENNGLETYVKDKTDSDTNRSVSCTELLNESMSTTESVSENVDDCINRVAAGEGIIRQRFTPKRKSTKKLKSKDITSSCTSAKPTVTMSKRKLVANNDNGECTKKWKQTNSVDQGIVLNVDQIRDLGKKTDLSCHYLLQKPDTIHPSIKTVFDSEKHCIGLFQPANITDIRNHHLLQPISLEESIEIIPKANKFILPKQNKMILPKQNVTKSVESPTTSPLEGVTFTDTCSNNQSVPRLSSENLFHFQHIENTSANAKTSKLTAESIKPGTAKTRHGSDRSETINSDLNVGEVLQLERSATEPASTANTLVKKIDGGADKKINKHETTESSKPDHSHIRLSHANIDSSGARSQTLKFANYDGIKLKSANVQLERLDIVGPVLLKTNEGSVQPTAENKKQNDTGSPNKMVLSMQPSLKRESEKVNPQPGTSGNRSLQKGETSKINTPSKMYYVIDKNALSRKVMTTKGSETESPMSETKGIISVGSQKHITTDVYKYLLSKSNLASSLSAENGASQGKVKTNPNSIYETQSTSNGVETGKFAVKLQIRVEDSNTSSKTKPPTVAEMLKLKRCEGAAKDTDAPLQIYDRVKSNVNDRNSTVQCVPHNDNGTGYTPQKSMTHSKAYDNKNVHVIKTVHIRGGETPKPTGSVVIQSKPTTNLPITDASRAVSLITASNQLPIPINSNGQHSYSLKIGDKMVVVQQVGTSLKASNCTKTAKKGKYVKTTLPAPKPKGDVKLSVKKATTKKRTQRKQRNMQQGKTKCDKTVLRLRRKVLKLLKSSEDPFDKLVFTLGLIPKDKQVQCMEGMLANRRCISLSPVSKGKKEHDEYSDENPISTKLAHTVQIQKDDFGNIEHETHVTRISFIADREHGMHRWHKFSDYPCTVHISDSNVIEQIDVESLKQGFYLITACKKSFKPSATSSTMVGPAMLSQYPPSASTLPLDSVGIAIGKLFACDNSAKCMTDMQYDDVQNAIECVLGSRQIKLCHEIPDNRYASVVDSSMSPKCQSAHFYSSDMREYFSNASGNITQTAELVQERKRSDSAKALEMLQARSTVKLTKYSAKAMALKIKQNELFESCRLLKRETNSPEPLQADEQQIPTGTGTSCDMINE